MRYLLSPAALLLATQLTAASPLDSRITLLEEQMKDLRVETMNGNFGAKTASAYPNLRSWGAYASVEGLYLNFREGGTDYAFDEVAGNSAFYKGKIQYFDFDWKFAFRVTAGYQFSNPDWDTWAEYIRFATSQSKNTPRAPGGSIDSNVYFSTGINTRNAKLNMSVNYNVVDWNVGRLFFLRKNFSVHPFAGIRGSWINQHQQTDMTTNTYTDSFYQKNDTWSLGFRTGSQGRWYFSKNWSAFGSAAASILYTDFSNSARLNRISNNVPNQLLNINLGNRRMLPNATLDAGISWEMSYACDRSRVRISAGYEFDYWWRQNQTIHLNAGTFFSYFRTSEDIALQGVKLNAAFDF